LAYYRDGSEGIEMVSQKFVDNLHKRIREELKDHLNGKPYIVPYGSGEDQWKGFGEDLKTSIIPFRKTTYEATEYLYARINLKDDYLSFMDFITPITNIKGKSIQGVGTFLTYIDAAIPETYVLRMVGLKKKLLPHEWVVNQGIKPKEIIKNNWIDSEAVNGINNDKELLLHIWGNNSKKIDAPGFSNKQYKIKIDWLNYPPGMFTVVPYKGYSFLIAKDAGDWIAKVDSPSYTFSRRLKALSMVASYIYSYPDDGGDDGEWTGQFYPDTSMLFSLRPLLKHIDKKVN